MVAALLATAVGFGRSGVEEVGGGWVGVGGGLNGNPDHAVGICIGMSRGYVLCVSLKDVP